MWTAETLARAFHESYARISPKFFGTTSQAPDWDSISEQSRNHLIAVCADVLGEPGDLPALANLEALEPVPEKVTFRRAAEVAVEEPEDGLSDWESDLRRQIDEIDAKSIRRAKDGSKG